MSVNDNMKIVNPMQGTDKSTLYNMLIEYIKSYMPDADFELLDKAYNKADTLCCNYTCKSSYGP